MFKVIVNTLILRNNVGRRTHGCVVRTGIHCGLIERMCVYIWESEGAAGKETGLCKQMTSRVKK